MNFDIIAPYYDLLLGDRSVELANLRSLVNRHKPEGRSLLDIACGTGVVLQYFKETHVLTGLDASAGMLQQALKKVPKAELLQGDMTDFELGRQFDVVLCMHDSMNQLMDFDQWRQVMAGAQRHLAIGGVFIFDYSPLARLLALTQHDPVGFQFKNGFAEAAYKRAPGSYVNWEVSVQVSRGNGDYRTVQELIIETAYPLKEVTAAAEEFFMEAVEAVDPFGNPADDSSERIYLICR